MTPPPDHFHQHRVADTFGGAALETAALAVALARMLSNSAVTTPIVSATKSGHLNDRLIALDLHLDKDETTGLEGH